MSKPTDYALLVSFPVQDEIFTLGVEAGIFWQRLCMGEREFEYLAHVKNVECLDRMALAMDLKVEFKSREDDEWCVLLISPKTNEKERPRLMLIPGGITVNTEKMVEVTNVLGRHEFFQQMSKLKFAPDAGRHDFKNLPDNALETLASVFDTNSVFVVNSNDDFDLVQANMYTSRRMLNRSEVFLSPIFPKSSKGEPYFVIIDGRKGRGEGHHPADVIDMRIEHIRKTNVRPPTFIVLH